MNAHVRLGYIAELTPANTFADLDDVRLLCAVETHEGSRVQPGAIGTILGVWQPGVAYEVEFGQGLATVKAEELEPAPIAR